MPRSKSRKTSRRGTAAAKAASSRARRAGQQATQADVPDGSVASRADGIASFAGSATASASPARPRNADTPAARQAPAGPAPVNGAPPGLIPGQNLPGLIPGQNLPGLIPGQNLPPGLVPVRLRAKGPAAKAPAAAAPAAPGAESSDDLPAWAAKAAEKVLTVTHWLDPGEHGDPFTAMISFSGRRIGVTGKPRSGDSFSHEEIVEGIVPGSGPVAITAEVRGVNPGEWTVAARPVVRSGSSPVRPYPPAGSNASIARRVPWPRQVVIPATPAATVQTAMLPFTKVPGIIRFAYASLVSLAVLTGLGLEALLLIVHHYSALRPLEFSVAAVAAGVVGGKTWYIAVHRGRKFDGWCIQGFVAGAVAVAAAAAFVGPGIPAVVYLSAAGPALLIGMGIGRPACFWAGCCTGRPTASRRGIWSSDRRLGCRREPAQLLEALAALVSGVGVLAVVLFAGLQRSALAAVAGLAAYTLSRQFILGLRAEPRQWQHGRRVTAAVAALVLIASVALLARG